MVVARGDFLDRGQVDQRRLRRNNLRRYPGQVLLSRASALLLAVVAPAKDFAVVIEPQRKRRAESKGPHVLELGHLDGRERIGLNKSAESGVVRWRPSRITPCSARTHTWEYPEATLSMAPSGANESFAAT